MMKGIRYVKRLEKNGMTYNWFVRWWSGNTRTYTNYRNGRTVAEEFPEARLPAAVKRFLKYSNEEAWSYTKDEEDEYRVYIYRQ